jgi:REP element-mobilizing transposase RayT
MALMKQLSFFKSSRKEHGGILSLGKRRRARPLSTRCPLHVTLRSDFAHGPRSLRKNQVLVRAVTRKAATLFRIRVYEMAICGNHLHLLVRGKRRVDLQNFFRVLAGHIAQEIVRLYPISEEERHGGGTAPQWVFLNSSPDLTPSSPSRDSSLDPAILQSGDLSESLSKRGCKKNRRVFWALFIYSRVVSWGREFRTVSRYILQNNLEALCVIAYRPRIKQVRNTS